MGAAPDDAVSSGPEFFDEFVVGIDDERVLHRSKQLQHQHRLSTESEGRRSSVRGNGEGVR